MTTCIIDVMEHEQREQVIKMEEQKEATNAPKYLSRAEFAERIGVKTDTLNRYPLPPHDNIIGDRRGWLAETIDRWNAARPGRGNWRNK